MRHALLSTVTIIATAALMTVPAAAQSVGKLAQKNAPTDCPQQFAALDSNPKITQQEASAVRIKAFDALDNDNNNIVSREEYVRCLASTPAFVLVGSLAPLDRVDQSGLFNRTDTRFSAADSNNDGKISWKEYMDAAHADQSRIGKVFGQTAQGASAAAGWAFARMDADLSGSIEKKEWSADSGMKSAADTSFRALDSNADGMVSQAEYLASESNSANARGSQPKTETHGASSTGSNK